MHWHCWLRFEHNLWRVLVPLIILMFGTDLSRCSTSKLNATSYDIAIGKWNNETAPSIKSAEYFTFINFQGKINFLLHVGHIVWTTSCWHDADHIIHKSNVAKTVYRCFSDNKRGVLSSLSSQKLLAVSGIIACEWYSDIPALYTD